VDKFFGGSGRNYQMRGFRLYPFQSICKSFLRVRVPKLSTTYPPVIHHLSTTQARVKKTYKIGAKCLKKKSYPPKMASPIIIIIKYIYINNNKGQPPCLDLPLTLSFKGGPLICERGLALKTAL
jgi:hypothetical protein